MTKNILIIGVIAAIFLYSCKETPKQEVTKTSTESVGKDVEGNVITTLTINDGKTLEISYNNTQGTAVIIFNGETSELLAQTSASGIWYKNDRYELRGKGNDIVLKKDGSVIFDHKDDIVNTTLKNNEGQTLVMTFNNTEGTVKVYLNGGEQIDLVAQKAASGIWYKNDRYELRGKGNNVVLTKDEEIVFKN